MDSSETSRQEIMEATYRALCQHGYSDLSVQKIADESEKGKSLIYYHFDDKHDLVVSFLEYILEKINSQMSECLGDLDTDEKTDQLLNRILAIDSSEMWNFRKALIEMRAQAIHDEEISEKLLEIDTVLKEYFEDLLREKGSEQPGREAEVILSTLDGFMERRIALGKKDEREEMKEYIIDCFFDQ